MKRTRKLNVIKELPNNKVEVEDTEGRRWIVGKKAYDRFQFTGFLHISDDVAKECQDLLNGRNFGDLSDTEQHTLIVKIIEAATGDSIENSFPDLGRLNSA